MIKRLILLLYNDLLKSNKKHKKKVDINFFLYIIFVRNKFGRLAQLVERFPYKEDVGSSSLSTPTIINKEFQKS